MNTYDTSEYLAKAKLAIADAWYPRRRRARPGAGRSRVQGLHPVLSRTWKRPPRRRRRSATCSTSRWRRPTATRCTPCARRRNAGSFCCSSPTASSRRRRSRCCATFRKCWPTRNSASARFYQKKGSFPAAANRLQGVADQFPLYSKADEALWQLADSLPPHGRPFRESAGRRLPAIVKDYPLSVHAEEAKAQLEVDEAAGSRGRSGGLRAHEVRAGEPHQAQLDEPSLGPVQRHVRI